LGDQFAVYVEADFGFSGGAVDVFDGPGDFVPVAVPGFEFFGALFDVSLDAELDHFVADDGVGRACFELGVILEV
jgi:hypothetical protein